MSIDLKGIVDKLLLEANASLELYRQADKKKMPRLASINYGHATGLEAAINRLGFETERVGGDDDWKFRLTGGFKVEIINN